MLQDPLTLYKLIILYMLGRVKFPLTTAQISSFILEKEYTNFLTLQQVISELTDTGLVESKTINNRTQLSLSKEGKETLSFFSNRISDVIKEDINHYFRENEYSLREEVSVLGDYYKSTSGEYEAHLIAKEQDINLIELTLSVPTKEIAEAVCDSWQKKNQEVYEQIIKLLF
ncbi:MAG: DUF4364 family protein [Lachnospiraceae bacterium]|nr:DUF4364 family protein [Lachnospiraceae bacterium]